MDLSGSKKQVFLETQDDDSELTMEGGEQTADVSLDQSQEEGDLSKDLDKSVEETPVASAPIPMPAVGYTLVFPRKDTAYKKKESLPYDEIYSNVWKQRPRNENNERIRKWVAFVIAGFIIGLTAFCMAQLEEFLVDKNRMLLQYIINENSVNGQNNSAGLNFWLPALTFSCFCALLGLLAGLMTTYYGQGASGSGVAELIGYMNGINYPDFIGVNTQITKILGVTMAVASRLCIGKEGPLAHIGAIWGAATVYIPGLGFEFLQNDEFKRQIIAAGGSAGVSAAFGAPIGGTLFAYEMSKPTVFWTFEMVWRTFTCCSISVVVLAILQTLASGDFTDGFVGSTVKFGNVNTNDKYENTYQIIPAAIVIGIVGGSLGALFIDVNTRMATVRKTLLKQAYMKPFETALWSFATGFTFIAVPYIIWWSNHSVCQNIDTVDEEDREIVYQGWCDSGYIDPNASIFWASEGNIIKNIMNDKVHVNALNQFYFLLVWYLFTITTYGTNVPAGLFLPGMIIGCALGDSLFSLADYIGAVSYQQEEEKQALVRSYIILACGGFMAGYTRMTYSLAVILMETSQDIMIFTPMIISIAVANQTGYLFTRSLYERATRTKQMPMIKDTIPPPCATIIASQVMSPKIVTLQNVDTVQNVMAAMKTSHHAFPILNSRGNVVGIIPKNYAITLIESRAFYRIDGQVEEVDLPSYNINASADSSFRNSSINQGVSYKKVQTFAKKKTFAEFSNQEDAERFPATPKPLVVPWQRFCRDFWSKDLKLTRELKAVCEYYENYMIDFRPYLIESPVTVFTTDPIRNCVELMRNMYLRHIIVISPVDGSLQGIITRQDLFAWLDL